MQIVDVKLKNNVRFLKLNNSLYKILEEVR